MRRSPFAIKKSMEFCWFFIDKRGEIRYTYIQFVSYPRYDKKPHQLGMGEDTCPRNSSV